MKKVNVTLCTFLLFILVAINFLYNGYLLTLFYAFTYSLYNFSYTNKSVPSHYANWFWGGLGFATVALLVIFGALEPIEWLTNHLLGFRKPLILEEEKIRKLLDEICVKLKVESLKLQTNAIIDNKSQQNKQQSFYANNLQLIRKIKIFVSDNQRVNAEAFGYNTIIISKGLLDSVTDREFKAVLVHEIAHLYHNDSLVLLALFWANIPMQCIMSLYRVYVTLSLRLSKIFSSEGSLFSLFAIVPLVLFSPIIVINYLGKWIMMVGLFIFMRAFEYRADCFTAELGFRNELISFLTKQIQIDKSDNSFFAMVFASHPSPVKRILRLEKLSLYNIK